CKKLCKFRPAALKILALSSSVALLAAASDLAKMGRGSSFRVELSDNPRQLLDEDINLRRRRRVQYVRTHAFVLMNQDIAHPGHLAPGDILDGDRETRWGCASRPLR